MNRTSNFWLTVFSLLFISGIASSLFLKQLGFHGTVAVIKSEGKIIGKIDLDAIVIPYEFTVSGELGENTIRVEPGKISVVAADCPDKICVRHPPISDGYEPIVCLPNRLVIFIEDSE